MGLLVALTTLLLAAGDVKPVPEGCEKRCEKQTVPCTDGRAEDQMMCFETIRRCEIRCDKPTGQQSQSRQSGTGGSGSAGTGAAKK